MNSKPNDNPMDRLSELTKTDLDYLDLKTKFKNLIELAQQITNIDLVLINLIDAHYVWPISQSDVGWEVMPLADLPCQFTITEEDHFEVKNLQNHPIFKDKIYVRESPFYKYYFGVPLKNLNGINIGTLSFFDKQNHELSNQQIKLLRGIANEVIFKIDLLKAQDSLIKEFFEFRADQRSIANDLRNPLAGIIGLSDVLTEQFEEIDKTEYQDYNILINKSSKSILSILDDIIINQKKKEPDIHTLNLNSLKERLIYLYSPLIITKNIKLDISVNELKANTLFLKSNVNFLVGNLLVEALLNVTDNNKLTIKLDLIIKVEQLFINVEFTSENLINTQNLNQNDVLKIYQTRLVDLGGELIFNSKINQLYQMTLPVKSI